jgi:hypothetical protein
MNRILLILLLPLSAIAQTTYPVLSTTTARTIVGGITNLPHLNSNNVFTGTGRWTGAVTLTNSGNVFAGDGSGLTGISAGVSTSGGSATNLSVYSSSATNRPFSVYNQAGTRRFGIDTNGYVSVGANDTTIRLIPLADVGVKFEPAGTFPLFTVSYYAGAWVSAGDGTKIGWTSGYDPGSGQQDTSLSRNSAGVVEVNNGTQGTFRDIVVRNLSATNLYATNLVLSGGATVTKFLSATASLNFDLTAVTVEDLTITVTGAATGDVVTLGVPNGSVTTSVQFTAWVSAADTVTVRARTSATGEDPASGTFRATVIKH